MLGGARCLQRAWIATALAALTATIAHATPTITITSPASGSTIGPITSPAGFTITANATPTAGASIASVQFFDNGVSIGTVGGTSPFSVTWNPTTAGSHTLTATVTDNSVPTTGTSPSVNTATATSIVTVTAARTVVVTAPANNATFAQDSTIFFRATAAMTDLVISNVQFFRNGVAIGGADAQAPYGQEVTLSAANGFAAGSHTITATATASDGTPVTSAGITINIAVVAGNQPPDISIIAPAPGSFVAVNQTVTVSATASDPDGFIPSSAGAGVTFFVDGEPITGAGSGETNPDLIAPYSITWRPTVAKTYSLQAMTVDDKNRYAVSGAISVTASATLPTVSVSAPATATVGNAVTLTANATASGGATVTQVQFLENGSVIGSDTSSPYSFSWTPGSTGTSAITARVTDSIGATATSTAVNVVVSTASPTVTLSAPSTVTVNTATTLTANATPGSGATVTQVQFFAGGTLLGTDTSSPYTFEWTPTATGSVALTARVTDSTGTAVTSSAVNVSVVVASGASVVLTSPTPGSLVTVGSPITLVAQPTPSAGQTVTQVQFTATSGTTPTIIGTDTTAPYTIDWTPTAAGNFTLTARVVDTGGVAANSTGVPVTAVASSVALTISPTSTTMARGSTRYLTAAVSSGVIPEVVEFLLDGVLIGDDRIAPYNLLFTVPIDADTGGHVLEAVARDASGATFRSNVVNLNFTALLGTAPTVAITTPPNNGFVTVGTTSTISGTAVDTDGTIGSVQVFANGASLGTATVSGSTWTFGWTPSAAGAYSLTAIATDNSSNAVLSSAVTVTAGAASGVTLALSPTSTTVPVGSSRFLTATVPATVAAERVDFYYDGTIVGTDSTVPYTLLFNAPEGTGSHVLEAVAVDSTGATFRSPLLTINVVPASGTAPSIAIVTPTNGAFLPPAPSQPAISGTVSDADGLVSSVQVFVNGVTGGAAGLGGNGVASVNAGTFTINWTPPAPGTYVINAIATDDRSNAAVAPAVEVHVTDNTSPTIALALSPGGTTLPTGATRNVLVTATPATGRAIVRVEFFVNGGKVGEDTSAPYTYRYTAPATPGTFVLSARAIDNADIARDVSTTLSVVTAVGQPPTTALITPTDNITLVPNSAISLAATANAVGGTITAVQFYQNGSPVANPIGTPPYSTSFTPTLPGTYVFDVIATDDRNNTAVSNRRTVTVAFGIPTITITAPRVNASTPNAPVRVTPNVPLTIGTTATPGQGANILLVEFLVDGIPVGTRPGSPNVTAYSLPWTPDSTMLGTHVLTTRVTDTNSVSATSNPINLEVAVPTGTPPTITITSPGNNATVQSFSTVNFIANAFATGGTIASVEFFLNEVSIGTATREQTTSLYRLPYDLRNFNIAELTPSGVDGNGNPRYTLPLYAIARDSNSNQTVSTTFNLNIVPSQSLPPSVTLQTLPTAGPVIAGTPFPVVVNVNDPDGSVTNFQLFSNGGNAPVFSGGSPPTGVQLLVQFTPQSAGRFNIYAVATDDTGNTTVSAPIVANISGNTAPTAVLVRPSDDSTVTTVNTPVFLEARSNDPDIGQIVTVSFINTSNGATLATGTRVGTSDVYRAIWTPTQANTYTVAARAQDNANGQTSSTASRRVVVSNVAGIAPTVTINVPGTVTTASTSNFTATATDSDGSVVGVEFFLNREKVGDAVRDQLANTWRLTVPFAGVNPGPAEVVARVRDSSGNVAASTTNTITVNAASSIAPSITITPSTTNAAFNRQVQLRANARDVDGTVTSVQYFSNGSSLGTSGNSGTNYQVNWTPNVSGTFNVWAIATDNSGITTVAPTVEITVRRNNPVIEDAAFILQTYSDITNTTNINPIVFDETDAALGNGTLTRADVVMSLTDEPGFVPPVNLLKAYWIIMGQWPTPANYTTLLATARGSLANAIGSILASNEYFAKFGVVPTNALLNNAASAIPARTFLQRLHANAGLPAPGDLEVVRFMNNDTTAGGTLARGYNPAGLNTALAEFITITNGETRNPVLHKQARAAALFYQLNRPPVTVSVDEITARVAVLAALPDERAMVTAALADTLYTYRYVTFTKHPQSLVLSARSGAIFNVEAIGAPPLEYRWLLNGAPIPNATGPILSLTNVDTSRVGTYTAVVTSATGVVSTSDPATLTLSTTVTKLANISTRGVTSGGANVLIGGFAVTGNATQTRQMLIRVVGPRLGQAPFNVSGFLADPRLEVYAANNPNTPILTNDNWSQQAPGTTPQAIQQATNRAGAFALQNNSADAAVLATLRAGLYTVQAKGPAANSSGIVLIEIYDVTQGGPPAPKAINVSTRGLVGTGANTLIAGFVVEGGVSRRMLIRGVGPTLTRFGLAAGELLGNPQLILYQENGQTIRTNDNWASGDDAAIIASASTAAGAFPLANGSQDAAMIIMLPPGAYTAELRGVNNGTGVGIVEVYDVDP